MRGASLEVSESWNQQAVFCLASGERLRTTKFGPVGIDVGGFARESRHVKLTLLLTFLLAAAACAQEAKPNTLTEEEKAAGFKLLFDGTPKGIALRGVQKSNFLSSGWKIIDDALTMEKTIDQSGKVTGGDLATAENFVDFEFHFEWKQGVSGNSGILYNAKSLLGGKPQGCEFQIIDDTHHPEGLKGGPLRRTGALNGVLPCNDKKVIEVTGWNKGRIIVANLHVEHWVNDEKVLEYEIGSAALQQAVKTSPLRPPLTYAAKARGPVVLLDQGENIAFRNLKLKVTRP